ncbi:HAD family hydrolase [Nibricoccus sp. IMCC34717]|uniref:HAD family hydrolase n=1 Tax=Nibricoccus sp. IMCC34717 TaxID=3034021 RepID=UPI00384F1F1E
MSRFQTVLFDLDGTLLDHFAAIHLAHAHTTRAFGLPEPTFDEVRRAIGGGLEVAIERIFGEANRSRVPEAVKVYRDFWAKNMLHGVALLPGCRALLEALNARGVTCGVLTNKHGPSARTVLAHLGVDHLFGGIFGALDTPWLKPEREFAQHALEELHASAQTTCLLGDSPYDIEAGRNAGFPCYCVCTGTHSRTELEAAGADGVYDDMPALAKAVFGLV